MPMKFDGAMCHRMAYVRLALKRLFVGFILDYMYLVCIIVTTLNLTRSNPC